MAFTCQSKVPILQEAAKNLFCFSNWEVLGEEHNPINGVDLPEVLSGLHSNSVEAVYRMKKKQHYLAQIH